MRPSFLKPGEVTNSPIADAPRQRGSMNMFLTQLTSLANPLTAANYEAAVFDSPVEKRIDLDFVYPASSLKPSKLVENLDSTIAFERQARSPDAEDFYFLTRHTDFPRAEDVANALRYRDPTISFLEATQDAVAAIESFIRNLKENSYNETLAFINGLTEHPEVPTCEQTGANRHSEGAGSQGTTSLVNPALMVKKVHLHVQKIIGEPLRGCRSLFEHWNRSIENLFTLERLYYTVVDALVPRCEMKTAIEGVNSYLLGAYREVREVEKLFKSAKKHKLWENDGCDDDHRKVLYAQYIGKSELIRQEIRDKMAGEPWGPEGNEKTKFKKMAIADVSRPLNVWPLDCCLPSEMLSLARKSNSLRACEVGTKVSTEYFTLEKVSRDVIVATRLPPEPPHKIELKFARARSNPRTSSTAPLRVGVKNLAIQEVTQVIYTEMTHLDRNQGAQDYRVNGWWLVHPKSSVLSDRVPWESPRHVQKLAHDMLDHISWLRNNNIKPKKFTEKNIELVKHPYEKKYMYQFDDSYESHQREIFVNRGGNIRVCRPPSLQKTIQRIAVMFKNNVPESAKHWRNYVKSLDELALAPSAEFDQSLERAREALNGKIARS